MSFLSGRNYILRYSLGRSQWLLSLRRGSVVTRLLGFWVRIPPVAWLFVSFECCVLSSRDHCIGLITLPEEFYRVRGV
jgi:hypothetical protein